MTKTRPANYTDSPLVTVQLMCHAGDVHMLPRAVASIVAQDLDPLEIELQILHDGEPTEATEKAFKEIKGAMPLMNVIVDPEKKGYYCVARNLALPHAWGFYIAHMDADNEWRPDHLTGLLTAMRVPTEAGWPHFAYTRREYVRDEAAPEHLPVGKSPLVPWTRESLQALIQEPTNNFVDTGDFLIGKGTLFQLSILSGCVWNSEVRRFGDWEIMTRLAKAGFRGLAIDQVSHVYHWHGGNLQTTRPLEGQEAFMVPEDVYESLKKTGVIIEGQRTPDVKN